MTVDRAQLPPAGTWTFDKAHTRIEFVARHMLSKVRGRFSEFDGTVTIAERPEDSHVEVEIRYDDTEFRPRVRDDGKGIDPQVLASQGTEGHYGLRVPPRLRIEPR